MSYEPIRRALLVLLAYGVAAYVVLLVGGWLRQVLALPPLFETLLHGGLLLGAPVAAVLAWYYPRLAETEDDMGSRGEAGEAEGP